MFTWINFAISTTHTYTDTKINAKFCGRIGNIVPKWRDKLILNSRKAITSCSEQILIFCSYVHVWLVLLDMTALILDLSVIISTMYYKRLNTEFKRLFYCNPQYKQSIFVHILIYDWNILFFRFFFFWIMIYLWLEGSLFVCTNSWARLIALYRKFGFFSKLSIALFSLHCLPIFSSECNCML